MAKQKKDFALIIWAFGWLLDVATRLRKIIQETGVTFEAFERLSTDDGKATLERVVQVIYEDHAMALASVSKEQHKPSPNLDLGGFVEVPDLPFNELIAWAERELGVKSVGLRQGDFCYNERDEKVIGRGRRFEYRLVSFEELVRLSAEQSQHGVGPCKAAFLAWLVQKKPEGAYLHDFIEFECRKEGRSLRSTGGGCVAWGVYRHFICREVPKT